MRKEYDVTKLKRAEPKYLRHIKESITMRLDPDVVSYFKSLAKRTGVPYQTLINMVLREYANLGLEPTANWKKNSSG
jgi:uncharacterized protein (DUF4415 family)